MRIVQSLNFHVHLGRGEFGGHVILFSVWAPKKNLKFFLWKKIGWLSNFPKCPSKKKLEFFGRGQLGGRPIFMLFKEKENQVVVGLSQSFRKRRIGWPPYYHILLRKK
jgi:hypothetical protein